MIATADEDGSGAYAPFILFSYCFILFCTFCILFCTILYCFHTVLYCFVLLCTVLKPFWHCYGTVFVPKLLNVVTYRDDSIRRGRQDGGAVRRGRRHRRSRRCELDLMRVGTQPAGMYFNVHKMG